MRIIVMSVVIAGFLLGCMSGQRVIDTTILTYQQQLTKLEDRNQDLERQLAAYNNTVRSSVRELEAIRERSASLEGTVDDTIRLFSEYQQEVERLISKLRAVQNTTATSQ